MFGSGIFLLSISGQHLAHPVTTDADKVIEIASLAEEEDELPPLEPEPNPTLFFAGEPVPLHKPRVAAKLERELAHSQHWCSGESPTLSVIRHNLPKIERIIRQQGLPEDMKYLAVAESFFRHDVSPKGAAGVWQLMPHTAKELGLVINHEIDERYHLEKATVAACQYIKRGYERFGNWTVTAAAYNRGIGGIYRAVSAQRSNTYYDLKLNRETGRYIFRVLAVKELLENPAKYGMTIRKARQIKPEPLRALKIRNTIPDVAAFAAYYSLSYAELRELNPWIVGSSLTVTEERPEYKVYIPRRKREKPAEVLVKETAPKPVEAAAPVVVASAAKL